MSEKAVKGCRRGPERDGFSRRAAEPSEIRYAGAFLKGIPNSVAAARQ
jgi:hypothetical protein